MDLIGTQQLDQLCANQLHILDLSQRMYMMESGDYKDPLYYKAHAFGMAAQDVHYTSLQLNPYCSLENPTIIIGGPNEVVHKVQNLVPEKDHKEATQWVLRLQADIEKLKSAINAYFPVASDFVPANSDEFDAKFEPWTMNFIQSNLGYLTYSTCSTLEKQRYEEHPECDDLEGCFTALYDYVYGPNPSDCLINLGRSNQDLAKILLNHLVKYFQVRNKFPK